MTTINKYKTNKKYRQWQRLYSCHSKRSEKKISISTYNKKNILLTKMILDTAVTSEDLSHTTMKEKSM